MSLILSTASRPIRTPCPFHYAHVLTCESKLRQLSRSDVSAKSQYCMIKLWETIYYLIILVEAFLSTYDHRSERAAGPVRSPVHKLRTGRLVFEWVTIGESLLLYVFLCPSSVPVPIPHIILFLIPNAVPHIMFNFHLIFRSRCACFVRY